MGRTIELSEHAYKALEETAQRQGQAPEALLETLIDNAAHPKKIYDDIDEFFRSLGVSEEELRAADELFQAGERAELMEGAEQEMAPDANV